MQIFIINGPNLNLLGTREPEIYGNETFDAYFQKLKEQYNNLELHYFQSALEGEIIQWLHQAGKKGIPVVLNGGGYSHTSVAIADAIKAANVQVVEVHISNIYARESFRHQSITGANCIGVISGLGLRGYNLAIDYLSSQSKS